MNADVPQLLEKLRAGEESALSALVAVLYDELRRIAARQLRGERPSHTLQPTALVHEAYLKLMGEAPLRFADRSHFLAVTSRVMRQVLVDYARARTAAKRGGNGRGVLPLADWTVSLEPARKSAMDPLELLDLDRAIEALACEDHSLAQLIEMRYFGGMTAEETAEALALSVHVVRHDLRLAQAWLRRRMRGREAQA